jgi:hypothetical protein
VAVLAVPELTGGSTWPVIEVLLTATLLHTSCGLVWRGKSLRWSHSILPAFELSNNDGASISRR